jgi:type I restriction enzyme S subunit
MSSALASKQWRKGQLQNLVFFQRGFDITQAQQSPGPFPVISSSGVTSFHSEARATGPGIVIGRKGTLGSVHYSEGDYWPHDTTLWSKDLRGNNPRFVYFYLHTINFKRFDVGNSNPTLNRNHIHDLPALIPPLDTQQRIADILSAYDDLLENNRRRIKLLEESTRLLYQEWFVRLRYPGHEHVKSAKGLPEKWLKTKVFDAMQVMSGGTPKTTTPEFWDGDVPFYTPKDSVSDFYVLDTEKHITDVGLTKCNSKLYPKDTIFITARGTVGNLNLAQRSMAMNQSCYALKGREGLSQKFLFCALREAIQHFQQHAGGAVFDAIIVDTFKLIPFVIPDPKLIKLFEGDIEPKFHQVENLLLQNQKLRAARDLLLPRLMSGEIAV